MAITREQQELRRRYIGASDVPIILGLSPWKSCADLWLQKTGRVEDEAENDAMQTGNLMEPVTRQWAALKLECEIELPETKFHPGGILLANLDGQVKDRPEILECKWTSQPEGYGDDDSGDIPGYVAAQCQAQLAVCGPEYKIVHVAVAMPAFRGLDFKMFHVQRDNEVCDGIVKICAEFWNNNVLGDVRPDDFKPSSEFLNRMRRVPSKTVPLDDALVDEWVFQCAVAKQEQDKADAIKDKIKAALGDAEAGQLPDGRLLTFYEQTTARVDTTRLKKEMPQVAAAYIKETAFRVMRLPKSKGK